MSEYHKINSLWKRDEKTKKFNGEWSLPEFDYLQNNTWIWDEKIDGTNIRITLLNNEVNFGGRTDNAQIPARLFKRLLHLFPSDKVMSVFPDLNKETPVILYGEGYGGKIQCGGNYTTHEKIEDFILFDVKVGHWWLKAQDVFDVANKLNISKTLTVGDGTLLEAKEYVQKGFQSLHGNGPAEGLVLRPKVELASRNGSRIIAKLKTRDFK